MNNQRNHYATKIVLLAITFVCALLIGANSSEAQQYYRRYRTSSGQMFYRAYRPTTYRRSPQSSRTPRPSYAYPSTTTPGSAAYLSSTSNGSRAAPPRSRRSAPYRLDGGDILAIVVDGVLGDYGSAPVHLPKGDSDILPSMGHAVPVRDDGTLPLPLISDISVRGMTVTQAEKAIARAYIKEQILKEDRVSVSLLRKRTVRVTVMHDDPSYRFNPLSPTASFYSKPQKKITTVDLPVDQASVLDALAESGARVDRQTQMQILSSSGRRAAGPGSQVRDGDVVGVESADVGYFYTSGNLPGGQFPIPTDRNLTIQQAAAIAGGQPYRPGSFGPSEYIVSRAGGGAYRVSDPSRTLVRPGDTITLQYSRAERAGNLAAILGGAALRTLP